MAIASHDSSDTTAQTADGEGTEGSDSKPPNSRQASYIPSMTSTPGNGIATQQQQKKAASTTVQAPLAANGSVTPRANGSTPRSETPANGNGVHRGNGSSTSPVKSSGKGDSIPLPAPDAHTYPKEPGLTRGELTKLSREPSAGARSIASSSRHGQPESVSSSASPTPSFDSEPSPPPSRPQSRKNSSSGVPRPQLFRAFSGKKDKEHGGSSIPGSPDPGAHHVPAPPSSGKAPSVKSDDGGQKFTLKDLLASGPKLGRRSSQRSAGSSKSSDGGRSATGDSTTSLLKKYGVCEKVAIGKGATSVVRLAHKWDRTEEKLYAVKEFRKRRKNETEKEYVKKLTAEFCISSTLHHVNIVETVDLVKDEAHNWCEVMEFCPGGDLYAAIKKGGMSPSEVECCFKQILTGVAYLHGQGVAHRDIKPENLFFDTKGHLKIGDYGASTVYRLPWEKTIHMSTGLCGSEPYIAPEQFLGKPYDARLVDIWACGIVYYCLHFQEMPWRAAQVTDTLYAAYAQACVSSNAEKAACPPTIGLLSPRACRPLIRKMLEPDPRQRYSIEEVMRHSWLETVEVCHESQKPTHIHVNAQALAQVQVVPRT